jgi:hypothetical protein
MGIEILRTYLITLSMIYEDCKKNKTVQMYLLGTNSTTGIDREKLKIENNHKAQSVKESSLRNKKVKKANAKALTYNILKTL